MLWVWLFAALVADEAMQKGHPQVAIAAMVAAGIGSVAAAWASRNGREEG